MKVVCQWSASWRWVMSQTTRKSWYLCKNTIDRSRIITSQSQLVRKGVITSLSPHQNLLATATSNQLVMAGPLPVNLPSAIRCAQKSNRRSIHSTNPCIDPLWLEHLLFSTLAIDMSIYVKDKNSSTEKVNCGITSLAFFSVFRKMKSEEACFFFFLIFSTNVFHWIKLITYLHDKAYFSDEGLSSNMLDMYANFMCWKHLLQQKLL